MTEFRYLNPVRLGRGLDKLQRVDGATHRAIHGKFRQRRLRDLTAIVEDSEGELYFVLNRDRLVKVVPGT